MAKDLNKEKHQEENANRIDEIVNIAEKHARTERHLEKDLPFTSDKAVKNAEEIQKERETKIEHLKDIVAYGEHGEDNKDNI